jgi:hypothetical protein
MNEEEYIQSRLEDQIGWYDRKSTHAQARFKILRGLEIVGGSAIPLIAGFGGGGVCSQLAVGLLGAMVVAIAAFLSLNQYQENWIEYRTTCESLRHEKFLYLTRTEPYDAPTAFPLLVQRVESLISKENSGWSQYTRTGADTSTQKA